jgi:hypothetical protein
MRRFGIRLSQIFNSICVLVCVTCFAVAGQAAQRAPDPDWRKFRDIVLGHFQDWVVSGEGPKYTLIYSEPPPTYTLKEYTAVLTNIFRGYRDHLVEERALGYNGTVRDLVVHLDYSFDPKHSLSALQYDVDVLSSAIYGTTHGARLLRLSDLNAAAGQLKAPEPLSISAGTLDNWLFQGRQPIGLFCPESGAAASLATLITNGPAGRYVSSDNSLVVLLVDRHQGVDKTFLPHIRTFCVDSDLILGGIIDEHN